MATVSDAGVIDLVDDAVGTATITASFAGDATYKPATATCTIEVKTVQEDCEGSDDFATDESENPLSYLERTTAAGWKATNAARVTIEDETYFAINGKTSAVGTITSPVLNGGLGSIKIRYANTYKEANGVSFQLDIKQNDEVVKTYTITKANAAVEKGTVYTELIENINVAGDFQMVFTNLHPTNNNKDNQDRVSIGRLCWTGYVAPTLVTPSVEKGIFSVADGEFVQFSTGNLQYEVGTNTWSFASEQYEVIGGEAYTGSNNTNYGMNVPGYTGKLDLFAWSCDGKFGVNPSNADADYTGGFADWGKLVDEEGWYTLSATKMNYLLNRQKDGKKLWTTAELDGKVVLILLPDNWNTETELVYGYVPATGDFDKNVLTIDDWRALEKKGAVLLPSGGSRTGGYGNKIGFDGETDETDDTRLDANGYYFHVNNVGDYGYYWLDTPTSSEKCKNCASYLLMPGFVENDPTKVEDDEYTRPQVPSREKRRGNSVRLVKAVTPDYTRTEMLGAGVLGTICLPGNVPAGQAFGATFYTVSHKTANSVVFEEVKNGLEAGKPYLFQAEGDVIYCFYGDETVSEPTPYNGMYGTFSDIELTELTDVYYFAQKALWSCTDLTKLSIPANRAYLKMGYVSPSPLAPAPGVRRISLGVNGQNTATGIENVGTSEQPMKMIIDGQLYIIRGEKMYDAQGKLVK